MRERTGCSDQDFTEEATLRESAHDEMRQQGQVTARFDRRIKVIEGRGARVNLANNMECSEDQDGPA